MKNSFRFLIFALALTLASALFAFASLADDVDVDYDDLEDDFDTLPVVFIASEAKGTGDGSSAENAMGNAEDYDSIRLSMDVREGTTTPIANSAYLKNAFRLAFDALKSTGGTIVVCGPTVIDSDDRVTEWSTSQNKTVVSNSPAEFHVVSTDNPNPFRITSVYDGVDYRETNGAKLVLDQTYTKSLGLELRCSTVFENLTISYKYASGNGWYSGANATVLIACYGNKTVFGEGIVTESDPQSGATAGRLLTIVGGDRYRNVASTKVTIKSGDWETVIAGGHGMSASYPAKVTGDATLNILGGSVKNLTGEGGLDAGGRGKNAKIEGALKVYIGLGATVGTANGSVSGNATGKTINYAKSAIKEANIKNFETATSFGKPKADPPAAPVITGTTSDSITVEQNNGIEYSLNGVVWQPSGSFTGLIPDTEYTVYARTAETAYNIPSDPVTVSARTAKVSITGTVSIKGEAKVGNTITVDKTGILPEDAALTYQWYRDGSAIKNATFAHYPVSYVDVGKVITVEVTAKDPLIGTLTSEGVTGKIEYTSQSPVLTADDANYSKENGTAEVSVRISSNPGISVLIFKPVIPEGFTLDSVANGEVFGSVESGKYIVLDEGTANGIVAKLTLKSSGTPEAGTYQISFEILSCDNSDENTVAVKTEPGIIIVSAETVIPAPDAPEAETITSSSVTLKTVSGCEYSIDRVNWQTSGTFEGLSPNTAYTFYARIAASGSDPASAISAGTSVTTPKASVSAPESPEVETRGFDTIVLVAVAGTEYSVDGTNWQTSNVFEGLEEGKTYTFYARYAETDTANASSPSEALEVTTALYGDANDDGKITALDIVRLKKHVAGADVILGVGADANGDKAVDSLDIVRLKKYFAEYDYTNNKSSVKLGPTA